MTENEISLNIERKRLLLENHNLRVKIIDLELINKTQAKQLILSGVVASLPSKDAVICEGYNKAKNEDYKNRNSLRHKSQDDYYSGWMDSYDFISKSKG